jgi:hypothetical protein
MIRSLRCLTLCALTAAAVGHFGLIDPAFAVVVNSEWNTGNGSWNVPGNWSPVGSG